MCYRCCYETQGVPNMSTGEPPTEEAKSINKTLRLIRQLIVIANKQLGDLPTEPADNGILKSYLQFALEEMDDTNTSCLEELKTAIFDKAAPPKEEKIPCSEELQPHLP